MTFIFGRSAEHNKGYQVCAVLACATISTGLHACSQREAVETNISRYDPLMSTVASIQSGLKDDSFTCHQVIAKHLARIEKYDKSSGLNAISVINSHALERAAEIDSKIAIGEQIGPLACVPIVVKDNFDTHDLPTTAGSLALRDSYPPDDAFQVSQLRQAGAIVIAKSNMAEWAFSPRQTVSSTHGTTANAYQLDRTPAGSSGGSASAVAAGFAVAALGSDTGNSIRGPSSHLSLFGIRSTLGLTSRDGVIPLALDRDIAGPMARNVEDAAILFSVVAGYDAADPVTELGRDFGERDYTDYLHKDGLSGARVGVLRYLAKADEADAEVLMLFGNAITDLKLAGATVVDPLTVGNIDRHVKDGYYCPTFRADMAEYFGSLGEAAPYNDVLNLLEDDLVPKELEDTFRYFARGPLDRSYEAECPFYLDHPGRRAFLDDVVAAMNSENIDVIIYPTWAYPPASLDNAREDYRGDNSQLIAPTTGMPAATVPMGFTKSGLPIGLQILARPYGEDVIFRMAYAYEQKTGHRRQPKLFPNL